MNPEYIHYNTEYIPRPVYISKRDEVTAVIVVNNLCIYILESEKHG